jgi:hypothetical protein
VQDKYKRVKTGENVTANITITSLSDLEQVNINLYIAIKNFDGDVIDSSQEILELYDKLVINRTLTVPIEAQLGDYIFYGRVRYNKSVAIASDVFEVGERIRVVAFIKINLLFILILIPLLFIILLFVRYERLKGQGRLLKLYLMISELRKLVEKGEFEKATKIYIRIKSLYHEPLTREILEDKDKLKEEIENLAKKLKIESEQVKTLEEKKTEKQEEKDKELEKKDEEVEESKPEIKLKKKENQGKKEGN